MNAKVMRHEDDFFGKCYNDALKRLHPADAATLFNLLIGLDGYTISSGILSEDLNGSNIVSIPLESDEQMEIGYIITTDRPMNEITKRYLEHLKQYIENYSA